MWMPRAWLSVRDLLTWHTLSQVGARRNALLASTELIQRRREHHEVEEFIRDYEAQRRASTSPHILDTAR
jgi:hypothetical protein